MSLFLLLAGISCWLLASLRYQVGFDYRFYESVFEQTSVKGFADLALLGEIEPGYLLLNKLSALLGTNYRGFLFLYHGLFTIMLFTWIKRYSAVGWQSVFLFITLQYFALSMNFLRQAMAALIVLLAYPALKNRQFFRYGLLVLLASSFHYTALVMLVFYFLLQLPITKLHYALAALSTAVIYICLDPALQWLTTYLPKYQHYFTSRYWQGNSLLYLIFPVGCFLAVLPLLRRTREHENRILVNAMYYALLIQVFITKHFLLERLSIYLSFFSLLALPAAAEAARYKRLWTGLMLAAAFAYFLFAATQGFHDAYPYYGIWNQAVTAP